MSLSSLLEADKELTTYLRERFAKPRFGGKPAAEAPLPGLYELLRLPVYRESEMRGKAPANKPMKLTVAFGARSLSAVR